MTHRLRWRLGLAVVALTLAPATSRAADDPHLTFQRGFEAYENGQYEDAASAFESVLASGVNDAATFYNLGNSYFKSGRLGPAIWNYRKAHALAPRDEDISANLEYARFLAIDSIEGEAQTDQRVETWLDRFTPAEAIRLPVALWLTAVLLAVLWKLGVAPPALWRRLAVTFLVLWAASAAVVIAIERRAESTHEAVVFSREIAVRNGPGENFDVAFVLHEGAEVVVEGTRGQWTEISLPGDLRGWIDSGAIRPL
ncbi:MAG: hypothetical protein KC591_00245 [Gemmatimonadetes bacterium]|nr:hypothetical protein [Gemmatimonadota bacterium]